MSQFSFFLTSTQKLRSTFQLRRISIDFIYQSLSQLSTSVFDKSENV